MKNTVFNPRPSDAPEVAALAAIHRTNPIDCAGHRDVISRYVSLGGALYAYGISQEKAMADAAALREKGIFFMPVSDEKDIRNNLPLGVFCRTAGLKDGVSRAVAVVGTRDMSPYGKAMADVIVRDLPEDAILAASLSPGVGAHVIGAALQCGKPVMAVMATSLDSDVYPSSLTSLAERVATTPGCILASPFVGDVELQAISFFPKNRILALADEVIVVESKRKGGSLVTARTAYGYGRDVYAVPGRLDDVRSRGCLELIADGIAKPYLSRDI